MIFTWVNPSFSQQKSPHFAPGLALPAGLRGAAAGRRAGGNDLATLQGGAFCGLMEDGSGRSPRKAWDFCGF